MAKRTVTLNNDEVAARRAQEEEDGATVTVVDNGDGTSEVTITYPDE